MKQMHNILRILILASLQKLIISINQKLCPIRPSFGKSTNKIWNMQKNIKYHIINSQYKLLPRFVKEK